MIYYRSVVMRVELSRYLSFDAYTLYNKGELEEYFATGYKYCNVPSTFLFCFHWMVA